MRWAAEAVQHIRSGTQGVVGTFSVFLADFDAPTNFVQMILGGGSDDQGWVAAYDAGGNMIGSCLQFSCAQRLTPGTSQPHKAPSLYTIDTGANNIAFRVAGGGGTGLKHVTSLSFDATAVPEPATVGLFVLGLLGVGVRRLKAGLSV
jgi:hypothetical protein